MRRHMQVKTYVDRLTMSVAAARHAAQALRVAIRARGGARIVAATGASQFDFLESLTAAPDIDWTRVEMFHLDEYVGLPIDHPASFRKYLLERLVRKTGMTRYHLLDGEHDAARVAEHVGQEIGRPYLIVTLDEACRRQQVGEGWFASIAAVPSQAISMSVRQILKSREIICIVPDARKAPAVKACIDGEVSPMAPASILQTHANATVYLDRDSAALLAPASRGEILADLSA